MATVKQHYANVLANVYSWMLGGFEQIKSEVNNGLIVMIATK